MLYSVLSDEPLQPPEPNFVADESEILSINKINVGSFSTVGGRDKFIEHIGLPREVTKMTPEQSELSSLVGKMESSGVFAELQDSALGLRERRY
jgi:hypothetical protein